MEETINARNRKFAFGVVTLWAVISLIEALARIWHADTWKGRGDAALIIFFVVVVWIACLRIRNGFDQLSGNVESKLLARLSFNAYGAIMFGYIALTTALTMMR
jgi:hypothetical protein